MEALIHHFKLVTDPACRRARPTTRSRGRAASSAAFVRADGSAKPARVHMRDPSFVNLQALAPTVKDSYIADLIATLAMLDPILGGIDR
jgi:NADH-quinone oxidoreductase subunit D